MDLKHEIIEFIKERDFGDGVHHERLVAHFKVDEEELDKAIDELIDEEMVVEVEDNKFTLTGRKMGRSAP